MSAEDELELVHQTAEVVCRKLITMRHRWLEMANYIHAEYHKEPHLWRQCKHPICKRFLVIVKEDGSR